MLQTKAIIVFLLFVFMEYSAGCGKKYETKKEYYPDGKLCAIYTYNDAGLRDGIAKFYFPNGKLQAEVTYNNNVRVGITKKYYESGTLESEWNYKDGKKNGISKGYGRTGELEYERYYKDGEIDGTDKLYFRSGFLSRMAIYSNGILLRPSVICFDEDGKTGKCSVVVRGDLENLLPLYPYDDNDMQRHASISKFIE